ncbi:MAG: metal-sensing transcriptional repressor [Bacilli bacterium]|nr:metal-sensing transcriptional repressor [Bacilli bacterium]
MSKDKTENCCKKKTYRGDNDKKLLTNRLNRIEGQINGIKKMVQEDAYCNDILIQLSAIENSIRSLSNQVLENHLYTCISRDIEQGDTEAMDEIISLFKKFNK